MFYFDDFFGKKVLKSSLLSDLEHFFTTRDFILASGELEHMQETARENRNFLCEKLNIRKECLITCKQTHSDHIEIYSGKCNHFIDCDSIISGASDTALILNFADCVPIIIYDPIKNYASITHAGWRGTASKIVEKTIQKYITEAGSDPKDLKAAIGPCIGSCCFSTKEDVFKKLIKDENKTFYEYNEKEDKYHIDLKLLNKQQLLDNGVEKIDICNYCTSCMSDLFFSYRKELGKTARHSAIIKLEKRNT